jgi:hypothetical protein
MYDMYEINRLQTDIMLFMKEWACIQNTPIPRNEIIKAMRRKGIKNFTALKAINALLYKEYIRRSVTGPACRSFYVLIRNIRQPED